MPNDRPSISAYFAKPSSPLPKRKHSPTPQPISKVTSSNANEPIEIDEFVDDDLSIQYLAQPAQKKARISPSRRQPSDAATLQSTAQASGATRTVESFFSKKTDKDARRNRRALAIQQAIDSVGSGGKKALQKYKLADGIASATSPQSGVAFEDYRVSAIDSKDSDKAMDIDRSAADETAEEHDEESETRRRRHAAWQKRLQAPSGLVPRRRSLNLDEAEAREARAALAEARGEEYHPDGEAETPIEERDDPAEVEVLQEAVKGGRGKNMKAGVSRAVKGRGKKKEEVGPSGQTYTPLEKQASP